MVVHRRRGGGIGQVILTEDCPEEPTSHLRRRLGRALPGEDHGAVLILDSTPRCGHLCRIPAHDQHPCLRMRRAYQRTMFYAAEKKVNPRIAAYALALESLATSYEERGICP